MVLDGSMLGVWWFISEGAAGAGYRSLVDPSMSSFFSSFLFFACVGVLLPQHVWCCVCFNGCIVVVALFINRGESLFREGVHSCFQYYEEEGFSYIQKKRKKASKGKSSSIWYHAWWSIDHGQHWRKFKLGSSKDRLRDLMQPAAILRGCPSGWWSSPTNYKSQRLWGHAPTTLAGEKCKPASEGVTTSRDGTILASNHMRFGKPVRKNIIIKLICDVSAQNECDDQKSNE